MRSLTLMDVPSVWRGSGDMEVCVRKGRGGGCVWRRSGRGSDLRGDELICGGST